MFPARLLLPSPAKYLFYWQSKQYLQTHTVPDAHATDIFSLAVTPVPSQHLITGSGTSSLKVYSTKSSVIHADSAVDEHPYPLTQTLERAHKLGCHHVCASQDGKVAASVGFGGEVKVWEYLCDEENRSVEGQWQMRGEITGTTCP